MRPIILVFLVLLAAPMAHAQGGPPAPPAWAAQFRDLRSDPPPPQLNRNSHFVISDEDHHELFYEAVANRGGIYIGVGTDQNYIMGAWAQPEVMVLMDFDQLIVDLHAVYRLAFLNAADADDFVKMWSPKDRRLSQLIQAEWPNPRERRRYRLAWRAARGPITRRFRRLKQSMAEANRRFFLSDPDQFRWVVDMYKSNRIIALRGDLTANRTVLDIAKAAQSAQLPVRVLYVSNAESYFPRYPDSYRRNMAALPMDERSVVLRTYASAPDWSPDKLYEYVVQEGANFQRWMQSPRRVSLWQMLRRRDQHVDKQISRITREPPPPRAVRKRRPRRGQQ